MLQIIFQKSSKKIQKVYRYVCKPPPLRVDFQLRIWHIWAFLVDFGLKTSIFCWILTFFRIFKIFSFIFAFGVPMGHGVTQKRKHQLFCRKNVPWCKLYGNELVSRAHTPDSVDFTPGLGQKNAQGPHKCVRVTAPLNPMIFSEASCEKSEIPLIFEPSKMWKNLWHLKTTIKIRMEYGFRVKFLRWNRFRRQKSRLCDRTQWKR